MLSNLSLTPPSPGRLLACVLVACLAIGTGGCGGCGGGGGGRPDIDAKWGGMSKEEWLAQKKKRDEAEAKKAAEERKKEEAAKKEAEAARKLMAEQRAAEMAKLRTKRAGNLGGAVRPSASGAPRQADLPELPSLPAAAADWKDDDFFIARISDDPALIPAVQYVAEHRVGDADAVALFEKLLQPESLAELRTKYFGPNTTRRRAPRGKADALTETLVAAVGANGTDASRACLRRLLEGRMQTDDDKAAALAALRVLVNPPCSENEDMIFELLTSDQWPSPSDKAKLTVGQLRAEAIKLLKPTASIAMRLRVARHLAARGAAPPWRELLEGLVLSDDPANLEAQIVLYQDRLARQDPTIDALEAAFTGCSSRGLGLLLRLPEQVVGPVDAQNHFVDYVSAWLWAEQFHDLLEIRLARMNSFVGGDGALLLAATVPSDAMRTTLYRFFQKLWHEDIHPLAVAMEKDRVIFDPGLLEVLKLVTREKQANAAGHAVSSRSADSDVLKEREAIEERWEAAMDRLLQLQCRRFEAAALERAVRAGGNLDLPPEEKLPTALPPGMRVLAYYSFDATRSGVYSATAHSVATDPIRVQYVKLDGQTQLTALTGFFSRQIRNFKEHEIDEGVWLDWIRDGAGPDRQQSLDVRIVSLTPERLTLPNERQRMVVEILAVEIGDPREPVAVAAK